MTATVNISDVTKALLEEAHDASSGRAARTLQSAAHAPLKQTLMALRASESLADHTAPGPATLLVLQGAVTLRSGQDELPLSAGDWTPIPTTTHSLRAQNDAVVLLTVAALEDGPQ